MIPPPEDGAVAHAGQQLVLTLHAADPTAGVAPAVVLCHGMSAHRRGKVAVIAEALAARGVTAVRFDHGGCGDSGGDASPIDVERRVAEVDAVLGWLDRRGGPVGEVGFAGSSMGAAVSLVAAVRHDARRWAGIATPLGLWPGVRTAAHAFRGRGLVIWGDADAVVPPGDSGWLVRRWGERATAASFAGGDHRLHDQVPVIAGRIAAFFAGQPSD